MGIDEEEFTESKGNVVAFSEYIINSVNRGSHIFELLAPFPFRCFLSGTKFRMRQ
jgi:hypothetical protein